MKSYPREIIIIEIKTSWIVLGISGNPIPKIQKNLKNEIPIFCPVQFFRIVLGHFPILKYLRIMNR